MLLLWIGLLKAQILILLRIMWSIAVVIEAKGLHTKY